MLSLHFKRVTRYCSGTLPYKITGQVLSNSQHGWKQLFRSFIPAKNVNEDIDVGGRQWTVDSGQRTADSGQLTWTQT